MKIFCYSSVSDNPQKIKASDDRLVLTVDQQNNLIFKDSPEAKASITIFLNNGVLCLSSQACFGVTFNGLGISEDTVITDADFIQLGVWELNVSKHTTDDSDDSFNFYCNLNSNLDASYVSDGSATPSLQKGRSAKLVAGTKFGKFRIVSQIGKGGMGVIYLAKHEKLNVYRALKVLSDDISEDDEFYECFFREARIASKIHHPNIIGVMDVETDKEYNLTYIVMEYIDGGSLRQILKKQRKLHESQAAIIIHSIADALTVADKHNVVHRDIKPDNIMFTSNGEVKLADLGIAKSDEDDTQSKVDVIIGTPEYLSPEQIEKPKSVDIRSDIYCLGATFFEIATGQRPYNGATTVDVLQKVIYDPIPDPRDVNPEVSDAVAIIIMKMLSKKPEGRYQAPKELMTALEPLLEPFTISEKLLLIQSIVTGVDDEALLCTLDKWQPFTYDVEYPNIIPPVESVIDYTQPAKTTSDVDEKKTETANEYRGSGPTFWIIVISILFIIMLGYIGNKKSIDDNLANMMYDADEGTNHTTPTKGNSTAQSRSRIVTPSAKSIEKSTKLFTVVFEVVAGADVTLASSKGSYHKYKADDNGVVKITSISSGQYRLKVTKDGYKSYSSTITVDKDSTFKLNMSPLGSQLVINTLEGATVTIVQGKENLINCVVPPSGKFIITDLPHGNYLLKVHAKGCHDVSRRLLFKKDEIIRVPLEKIAYPILQINSEPFAQMVILKNGIIETTGVADINGGCCFTELPPGEYSITVKYDLKEMVRDIKLKQDTTVEMRFSENF